MGFYELQEKKLKTLLKTATAAAVLGLLAACGGGDASSVAGDVVEISFSNPSGVRGWPLDYGNRFASSKSGKLTKMAWSVSNGGAAGSTPTLVNDDCKAVQAVDSSFGKGASDWSCTLTLQAPKDFGSRNDI